MMDGTNVTEFRVNWVYQLGDMVFIVKWQSSVTPRFFTESDKGTDAQPTVIMSGKEKERDLDFRPENVIIASVLSSFSLSLFNVIQDLMSSIHFCIERKRSGIWLDLVMLMILTVSDSDFVVRQTSCRRLLKHFETTQFTQVNSFALSPFFQGDLICVMWRC